jgi:dynein heavy chain
MVKKLVTKHPTFETVHPFVKLRTTIVGFKESLPLIESLKQPFINERHFKRIIEETGKDIGEINFKTLTLSKVFELELQNCEDKVNEIVVEAKAEAQNEENIAKIDQAWRVTNFNIIQYKKNGELKGYAMTSPEEIR